MFLAAYGRIGYWLLKDVSGGGLSNGRDFCSYY